MVVVDVVEVEAEDEAGLIVFLSWEIMLHGIPAGPGAQGEGEAHPGGAGALPGGGAGAGVGAGEEEEDAGGALPTGA